MAIDRKYGRVELERGDIGEDEPVFVVRAQDVLSVPLLEHYSALCQQNGSPQRHVDGNAAVRLQFLEWQRDHFTQVPLSAPAAITRKDNE